MDRLLTRLIAALAPPDSKTLTTPTQEDETPVKVQIDSGRCQGHGRCYDLAPELFGADDEGYGQVLGDGIVPPARSKGRAWPPPTAPSLRSSS